jgi:hypothetical protein
MLTPYTLAIIDSYWLYACQPMNHYRLMRALKKVVSLKSLLSKKWLEREGVAARS